MPFPSTYGELPDRRKAHLSSGDVPKAAKISFRSMANSNHPPPRLVETENRHGAAKLVPCAQEMVSSADSGRRDVFLFNCGTATNVWFDGLRGIFLRVGVPCSSVPSKRPAVAKYRETARQAAASTERP